MQHISVGSNEVHFFCLHPTASVKKKSQSNAASPV
tara:strand:+ start:848 stop:952 length:105 start_codon:yes stop_codon:yes gene_type:complete